MGKLYSEGKKITWCGQKKKSVTLHSKGKLHSEKNKEKENYTVMVKEITWCGQRKSQ